MRKNSARKWLHFVLDLLPVILIPVFMIYSHRHTLTERTDVDVQYKYQTNEVNSYDDLVDGNLYHIDSLTITANDFVNNDIDLVLVNSDVIDLSYNDSSLDEIGLVELNGNNLINIMSYQDSFVTFSIGLGNTLGSYVNLVLEFSENTHYISFTNLDFYMFDVSYNETYFLDKQVEIKSSQFNVIESVDVQDTNSDIMSVFMDDFNNAVDKYFNFGNVFNLHNVYSWFNTNVLNGANNPTLTSIYNIFTYELLMDLLFLLYSLFMWFIDFCQHLIERTYTTSDGERRRRR